jgi:hypothetical protein
VAVVFCGHGEQADPQTEVAIAQLKNLGIAERIRIKTEPAPAHGSLIHNPISAAQALGFRLISLPENRMTWKPRAAQ